MRLYHVAGVGIALRASLGERLRHPCNCGIASRDGVPSRGKYRCVALRATTVRRQNLLPIKLGGRSHNGRNRAVGYARVPRSTWGREYCQYLDNGKPLLYTVGNDSTLYRLATANRLRHSLNQTPEDCEMYCKDGNGLLTIQVLRSALRAKEIRAVADSNTTTDLSA